MEGMRKRIRPIADVMPDYDSDASTYPDSLRVAMRNGVVVKYRIDREQPHPAFLAAVNLIRKHPKGSYQYEKAADCDGSQR